MSSTVILAAAAAFALGCVFCLGLWWLSAHRSRRGRMETMKAAVWLCLFNGCAWVWCSYLLAYLGRAAISQNSYPGKPSQDHCRDPGLRHQIHTGEPEQT